MTMLEELGSYAGFRWEEEEEGEEEKEKEL